MKADLIIKAIKARAVQVPMPRPMATASGVIPSAPLLLIDIETEQDITGRSYVFGYTSVTLRPMMELVPSLAEVLVGKPVAPVERMAEFEATFRLLGRQGLLGMVLSGIDMALWDALGSMHEVSVARLLGGQDKPIPAYDSYGIIDPSRDAGDLENSLKQGFKAIKIKVGGGDLDVDRAAVKAVRDIIGSDVALMIDYNQSLTVPEAVRRIDSLAEFDLTWAEEPVPAEDLAGHANVRQSCTVPIQTGENWWFPADATRAIQSDASDFAMLDIMKIGGVTGWVRAAGQAEGASLPVSSHAFVEASAHVLAVTPTCHFLEFLDKAGAILQEPAVVEDGKVRPRGPGLGMDWDAAAVEKYSV
ncbi:MAG: mandelate racemase [Rhizobiales bacterium]|nr:mandelate racemase [Hyphomicrobiales bacterium]